MGLLLMISTIIIVAAPTETVLMFGVYVFGITFIVGIGLVIQEQVT